MKAALALGLALLAVGCSKKSPSASTAGSAAAPAARSAVALGPGRPRIDTAEIAVPAGKSNLHVAWSVPDGTAINEEAPFALRWTSSDGLVSSPTDIHGQGKDVRTGFDIPIEIMPDAAGGMLSGDLDIVVCDTITHSVCVPIKRRVELTFAATRGAAPGRVILPLPRAKS